MQGTCSISRICNFGGVGVSGTNQVKSKAAIRAEGPSRRKANKRRPRGAEGGADGGEPAPKRKCSTRSKVAGVFTSGATAALIRETFPNQKGVVVSETAPMPEDLLDISLEEVVFTAEWIPEAILPDNLPVENSSQDEIVEVTPELERRRRNP